MRNVVITTLTITVMTLSFNANARFSIELEYELMQRCIQKPWTIDESAEICACAIRKSNYEYSSDGSFYNNESGFMDKLEKNIDQC
jgi:hypothetical protein